MAATSKMKLDMGNKLPSDSPQDGDCYYLREEKPNFPVGFYVYDKTKPGWTLVNEYRNRSFTNINTTDALSVGLTNNYDIEGRVYARITLSSDNTHAQFNVKGSGEGIAKGYVFYNCDTGNEIVRFDDRDFTYLESKVWTQKNFKPEKLEPRHILVEPRVGKHEAKSGETLFVHTIRGPAIIGLPPSPRPGDHITIIDAAGNFGNNKCIVGLLPNQLIDGCKKDLVLDYKDNNVILMYRNTEVGWIILQGPIVLPHPNK